jgi:hypothetical protein
MFVPSFYGLCNNTTISLTYVWLNQPVGNGINGMPLFQDNIRSRSIDNAQKNQRVIHHCFYDAYEW